MCSKGSRVRLGLDYLRINWMEAVSPRFQNKSKRDAYKGVFLKGPLLVELFHLVMFQLMML